MAAITSRGRFGSFPIIILFGYASSSSLTIPETVVGPPSIRPVLILEALGLSSGIAIGHTGSSPNPNGILSEVVLGTVDVITPIVSVGFEEAVYFGDPYLRHDLTAQSAGAYGDLSLALPEGLSQVFEFGVPPVGAFLVAGNLAGQILYGEPIVHIKSGPPASRDFRFGTVSVTVPHLDVRAKTQFGHVSIALNKPGFLALSVYPIPPGRRQPTYLLEVLDEARLPSWKTRLHRTYARSLPSQQWPARCWQVK